MATINWTNQSSQKLPVHYIPDSETPDGGLKKQNVEDAISYASGAYSNKALPTDKFILMHKNSNKKVQADLVNKDHEIEKAYVASSSDERSGLYEVVRTIGPSLPKLEVLA